MIDKYIFRDVRLSIYTAMFLTFILQYKLPLHYSCSEANPCSFCGLRHAVDCILKLDFAGAYKSNPLIILMIIIFIAAIIDICVIAYKKIRKR